MATIGLIVVFYLAAGGWFWYACSAAQPAPIYFIVAWPVILALMLLDIMFRH